MQTKTKPAAQLSLETIMEQNRAAALKLRMESDAKLAENARIEVEMQRILATPPSEAPESRLVAAYKNGTAMKMMELENAQTVAPPPPSSSRMAAEREVVYAALAIVRSWNRRHKKNWKAQERELASAVEKLTWDK